jgi:hypothetical protein
VQRAELVKHDFVKDERLKDDARELGPWVGRFDLGLVKRFIDGWFEWNEDEGFTRGIPFTALYRLALSKSDPERFRTFNEAGGSDGMTRYLYIDLIERYATIERRSIEFRLGRRRFKEKLPSIADEFGCTNNQLSSFLAALDEIFEILHMRIRESSFSIQPVTDFQAIKG